MEIALFIFSLGLFIGAIVVGIFMIKTDKEVFWSMVYGAVFIILIIAVVSNGVDAFCEKNEYPYCVEIKSYKVDTTSTIINGIPTDTIYTLYYK